MDHGLWIKDHGSKIEDQVSRIGSRIKDHGSRIMDHGSRIQDPGSKDPGSWTLFWYRRSKRDTDVISRLSKSTIQDLSFYIGFTRIGSKIQDLGPCFGMNGHFRRDPDVISRLPDTTIHFLSVFIGFEC